MFGEVFFFLPMVVSEVHPTRLGVARPVFLGQLAMFLGGATWSGHGGIGHKAVFLEEIEKVHGTLLLKYVGVL